MLKPIKIIWNDDIKVIDGEWKQYNHETKQWGPVKRYEATAEDKKRIRDFEEQTKPKDPYGGFEEYCQQRQQTKNDAS